MEPLLRFENVSKHYPNGVHALKGVSFEMAEWSDRTSCLEARG